MIELNKRYKVVVALQDWENVAFKDDLNLPLTFDDLRSELKKLGERIIYRIYCDQSKLSEHVIETIYKNTTLVHVPNGVKNRSDFRLTIEGTRILYEYLQQFAADEILFVMIVNDTDFVEFCREVRINGIELLYLRKSNQPYLPLLAEFATYIDTIDDEVHTNNSLEDRIAIKIVDFLTNNQNGVYISQLTPFLRSKMEDYNSLRDLKSGENAEYENWYSYIIDNHILRNKVNIEGEASMRKIKLREY